jgi:hypothetical protein
LHNKIDRLEPECSPSLPAACSEEETAQLAEFMTWDMKRLDAEIAKLESAEDEYIAVRKAGITELDLVWEEAEVKQQTDLEKIWGGDSKYNSAFGLALAERGRRQMDKQKAAAATTLFESLGAAMGE